MPILFSYGTLQRDDVQRSLFGRRVVGTPDELCGFARHVVHVPDARFARSSGSAEHAIVRFTGRAEDCVAGTALELTDADMAAADAYEPAGYVRVPAQLTSGRAAWVFASDDAAAWPSATPATPAKA